MATSKELSEWLVEHYAYEVLMLRFTRARLKTVSTQWDWNAYFESCAMHVRNLRDFYCGKGKSNTRKSADYGAGAIAKASDHAGAFIKINEQMDHPSTNRAFDAAGKLTINRLDEVIEWLEECHAKFIQDCAPGSRVGWHEGLATPQSTGVIASSPLSATNHVTIGSTVVPRSIRESK